MFMCLCLTSCRCPSCPNYWLYIYILWATCLHAHIIVDSLCLDMYVYFSLYLTYICLEEIEFWWFSCFWGILSLKCLFSWLLDHWHACITFEITLVYKDPYVVFSPLFSYYAYHSSNSMWIYIMIVFMFILLIYVFMLHDLITCLNVNFH